MKAILIGSWNLYFSLHSNHSLITENRMTDIDLIVDNAWFNNFIEKYKNEIQYLLPEGNKYQCKMNDGVKIEFEFFKERSNRLLLNIMHTMPSSSSWLYTQYVNFPTDSIQINSYNFLKRIGKDLPLTMPGIELAYYLKKSHLGWNVHWKKTLSDLKIIKKQFNTFVLQQLYVDRSYIIQLYKLFYETRCYEHSLKFGKRKVNLNKTNKDFFAASQKIINRKYDHDSIHDGIKYTNSPIYKKCQVNPNKAILSFQKYNELSNTHKKYMILEEIETIALERYLLPKENDIINLSHKNAEIYFNELRLAYELALKDLIIRLTSGWFKNELIEYAINENYQFNNYFAKFLRAKKKGIIKLYKDKNEII